MLNLGDNISHLRAFGDLLLREKRAKESVRMNLRKKKCKLGRMR